MFEDDPTDDTERHEPVDALESHPAERSGRRGPVTVAVVVLALAAAGLTGAALARGGSSGDEAALAASTGSASATPAPDDRVGRLKAHRFGGRGPGLLGMAGALHGSFVVPDGSGGFTTVVMQHGKASAVSDTAITVTSDDGFKQTYVINGTTGVGADRQGTAGIDDGADVIVMGTKKGDVVTADHLVDVAAFRDHLQGDFDGPRFGGPGPGLQQPDGDQPTPSQSGAAEGSAFGA